MNNEISLHVCSPFFSGQQILQVWCMYTAQTKHRESQRKRRKTSSPAAEGGASDPTKVSISLYFAAWYWMNWWSVIAHLMTIYCKMKLESPVCDEQEYFTDAHNLRFKVSFSFIYIVPNLILVKLWKLKIWMWYISFDCCLHMKSSNNIWTRAPLDQYWTNIFYTFNDIFSYSHLSWSLFHWEILFFTCINHPGPKDSNTISMHKRQGSIQRNISAWL